MLQYLIILLDKTSTSFCHYTNKCDDRKLISLETLQSGIIWGMKQNLMIQFIYPDYELPAPYQAVIETVDHCNIMPNASANNADIIVFEDLIKLEKFLTTTTDQKETIVLRISKRELFENYQSIIPLTAKVLKLNLLVTDIETFSEKDFQSYTDILSVWKDFLCDEYLKGDSPQINILTDRIFLNQMNNCNAGERSVTLAPNGKFYICPAFYYDDENDYIGDIKVELEIPNKQLYKIGHAPICRICDAYQCKRCIWLNRKMTKEVNTPSHEQCVIAHLERNMSRNLINDIQSKKEIFPEKEIKEIDYLDPFDIIKQN